MERVVEVDVGVHEREAEPALEQEMVVTLPDVLLPQLLEDVVQVVEDAREVHDPRGIDVAEAHGERGLVGAHAKSSGQVSRTDSTIRSESVSTSARPSSAVAAAGSPQ